MRKGNRLAAMIMAAVLAAGTVTGPVFAADYTTIGEFLTEAGTNDSLSENGEMTAETAQEDGLLSSDPVSEADGSVSESFEMDGSIAEPAAEDRESVSALSTTANDWSEDGNTTDEQLPEGAEFAEGGDEIADPADSAASEATDQAAVEEIPVEDGEGTEAEAAGDSETPGDADTSADGAASVDETEDVTSGLTDDGEIISDETPAAEQVTEENPAPVQEDNALTEDPAATENPSEFLTEDPAAVAEPVPADINEGQNTDAEILEEPGAGETVSEEKAADSEEGFNPITTDSTSVELQSGEDRDIYVDNSFNDSYDYENIKSVKSSDSKVLTVKDDYSSFIIISAKKPGNAKVTIEGTYGTVLTIQVKVVSFLEKTSVTVKAGTQTTVTVYDSSLGFKEEAWYGNYSTSSSNRDVATASFEDYEGLVVKGNKPGNAVITVKDNFNGSSSTLSVKVVHPPFNLSASKLTIDRLKTWQVTASGSDIGKVTSSNTKILKVNKVSSRKVQFIPVGHGKATVTITNKFGTKRTVSVAVSYKYFRALLIDRTRTGTMIYGSTVLKGKTAPSAAVSVRYGGKTYSCKADSKGYYAVKKIPVVKYGTKFKLTYKLAGTSITKTVKVGKGKSTLYTPNYTYKNTTSIPVRITNAHGGDQVIIQIAGKKYYKKIGRSTSKITVKVPIRKPGKYGIKMAVKLKNKFKQDMAVYYDYVYLSDTVYVGYTKAKVKWLTGWNDPDEKTYSAYGETWYYDWDGDDIHDAYLYFDTNGKVTNWYVYE